MKKVLSILMTALAALAFASCDFDSYDPDMEDATSVRVGLCDDPGTLSAEGCYFQSSVVVAQGKDFDVDWTVSVDHNPYWIVVKKINIDEEFTGTYKDDDRIVTKSGIGVSVAPNSTGNKRTAYLRFTTGDGSSVVYKLTQSR